MKLDATIRKAKSFGRGGWDMGPVVRHHSFGAVSNAFLPVQAVVPLGTSEDDQARCLVFPGDRVEECQIIGRAEVRSATNIHSPIPGTVSAIRSITGSGGASVQAVVIELGGSFSKLGRRPENFPWRSLSAGDIVHILTDKGVLCLGREPRPMQQVVSEARKQGNHWIILNCLDAEPYLVTETTALTERTHAVAEGLEILAKAASAEGIVIAGDGRRQVMLEALKDELSSKGLNSLILLTGYRYPQAFPRQLKASASCLEPRYAPAGSMSRASILDPSSCIAVRDAVAGNKPFIERYITVAGEAVKRPRRLKVRIGMKVGDVFEECGGFRGIPEKIVLDGPLTGSTLADLDSPVSKTTTAILALSRQEVLGTRKTACIRCGRCIDVCPEGLDPQRLYSMCSIEGASRSTGASAALCTACGLCGYICPSRLPLVETFMSVQGRKEVRS